MAYTSKNELKPKVITPNEENIDDIESTLKMLNELIRLMPKDWRDTND